MSKITAAAWFAILATIILYPVWHNATIVTFACIFYLILRGLWLLAKHSTDQKERDMQKIRDAGGSETEALMYASQKETERQIRLNTLNNYYLRKH